MTRGFFLYLSRSRSLRGILTHFAPARRATLRFVAGETPDQAIAVIQGLNARGILASVDCLGENVNTPEEAARARDAYLLMLAKLAASGMRAYVSLKLTQFGLDVDRDLCRANVAAVARRAAELGLFVRLDMEDHTYTARTIAMWRSLREEFENVGLVIQAYLYRSEEDVRALAAEGANIRLCKGAYDEPADVAFPRKRDVDANMIKLMQILLSEESRARGARLAMATHDTRMIAATRGYVAEHGIAHDAFEFQMLYGVRCDLHERLAREGYRMRVYVPYGTEWYPYFMRRLAERPANVWFIASNALRP